MSVRDRTYGARDSEPVDSAARAERRGMAKREVTASQRRRTAADLFAEKARVVHRLTPDQIKLISDVLKRNDAEPILKRRVGSRAVHEVLTGDYGFVGSVDTLERWACEALGRKSWGSK